MSLKKLVNTIRRKLNFYFPNTIFHMQQVPFSLHHLKMLLYLPLTVLASGQPLPLPMEKEITYIF